MNFYNEICNWEASESCWLAIVLLYLLVIRSCAVLSDVSKVQTVSKYLDMHYAFSLVIRRSRLHTKAAKHIIKLFVMSMIIMSSWL